MRSVAVAITALTLATSSYAGMPPTATSPRANFVGVWSFDGSCASGDGMVLKRDGKASYDENGEGLWAVADAGQRLVLLVEDISEEADRKTEAQLVEFRIAQHGGNAMTLTRASDGVTIQAKRCKV